MLLKHARAHMLRLDLIQWLVANRGENLLHAPKRVDLMLIATLRSRLRDIAPCYSFERIDLGVGSRPSATSFLSASRRSLAIFRPTSGYAPRDACRSLCLRIDSGTRHSFEPVWLYEQKEAAAHHEAYRAVGLGLCVSNRSVGQHDRDFPYLQSPWISAPINPWLLLNLSSMRPDDLSDFSLKIQRSLWTN